MKTDKNLKEFIEYLKKSSPEIPVDSVKSFIDSGKSSPFVAKHSFQPRRINHKFNPLKFFIMITPIVIITSALLVMNPDVLNSQKSLETRQTQNNIEIKLGQERQKAEDFTANIPKDKKTVKYLDVPVPSTRQALSPTVRDTQLLGTILDLSKEELTRLGFMFDEEGYYYLNQLPDGTNMNGWSWHTTKDKSKTVSVNAVSKSGGGSVGWGSGKWVNKNNKSPLHTFDFYPVITTDLKGRNINPINQFATQATQSFELMNDTLVPVLFSRSKLGGYDTEDKLIWFKVSDQFFDLLNTEQSEKAKKIYHIAKVSAQNNTQADRIVYDYDAFFLKPFTVKLKPQVLECFGIVLSKDRVDYLFTYAGVNMKWWVNQSGIGVSNYYTVMSPNGQETIIKTDEDPLRITDGSKNTDGSDKKRKCPMIFAVSEKDNGKTITLNNDLSDLDLMVPVQIDDPTASDFLQEIIIWIYPTEQFFNCLPFDIADQMRKEFNYQNKRLDPNFVPLMGGSIRTEGDTLGKETEKMGNQMDVGGKVHQSSSAKEESEPVPCVYFTNLCESLPGLDYVNLYPNPATDKLTIDLVLQKAKKIQFRVFDLSGRLITDEESPENYPDGGQFKHQVNVSRLQPGLYLLVMTDNEGAKVTRRFVKN